MNQLKLPTTQQCNLGVNRFTSMKYKSRGLLIESTLSKLALNQLRNYSSLSSGQLLMQGSQHSVIDLTLHSTLLSPAVSLDARDQYLYIHVWVRTNGLSTKPSTTKTVKSRDGNGGN